MRDELRVSTHRQKVLFLDEINMRNWLGFFFSSISLQGREMSKIDYCNGLLSFLFFIFLY